MRNIFILVAVITFCGCANSRRDSPKPLKPEDLVSWKMYQFVERRTHLSDISINRFQRDTRGQKLFINFSFMQGNEKKYQTAIVTSNEFTVIDGAQDVFYNDLGEPTARLSGHNAPYEQKSENSAYVLKNGTRLPCNTRDEIRKIAGSDCFLIRQKGKSAWTMVGLGDLREPMLDPPPELSVFCASLHDGQLVIFGNSKLSKGVYGVDGLVYGETPHGYKLQEEIPIPWACWAYDFDPESGKVIVAKCGYWVDKYYLFDIQSKHRHWLGFVSSNDIFFLSPDLVRALRY